MDFLRAFSQFSIADRGGFTVSFGTGFNPMQSDDIIHEMKLSFTLWLKQENKHLGSDYSMQIATWHPRVLIEIHGHGKVRTPYDVEISCGSAEFTSYSEDLAAAFNRKLAADATFADVSVCGLFSERYLRSTKTLTITDASWLAYHIELSSRLRKSDSRLVGRPTDFATALKRIGGYFSSR
jgi:hypothetical protein